MKIIILLALLSPISAHAAPITTTDNVDYNIVVSEGNFDACVRDIQAIARGQGRGVFQTLPLVGIVSANLTSFAANQVAKLRCVGSIEVDGTVHTRPRTGRSN